MDYEELDVSIERVRDWWQDNAPYELIEELETVITAAERYLDLVD